MTPSFSVRTTPRFDRLLRALARRHAEIAATYADALAIVRTDPHNRSHQHRIRKLESVRQGDANTALRSAGGASAMISMSETWCSTTAACVVKLRTADASTAP